MSAPARARPTSTDLASFGLVLPAVFTVAGVVATRQFGLPALARTAWAVGAILTLLYWSVTALRWPLHEAWMAAVQPLGTLLSHLLVAAVFFGLVTPIGLLARALGRNALGRRRDARRSSYWVVHRCGGDASRYLRQS